MNKRAVIAIVSIIGFLCIPLVIWGFTTLPQQGRVAVSVEVLPGDATVKINDQDYSGQKTIHLEPGTYTAVVSHEGFETDTQQLIVEEGDKDLTLFSVPSPNTSEAERWVLENQGAYQTLEGKAGAAAVQEGAEFIEAYPLTKWLPVQKSIYTIGYKEVSGGIIVTINAFGGYREAALQEIRDLGFDPSDYTIEFVNYRNPFNE